MPGCPNCGRQTARTEDWACQWCGYPLRSDAFPVIQVTYAQLQAERLAGRKTPGAMDARTEKEPRRLEEAERRKAEIAAREQTKRQAEEDRHRKQAEQRAARIVSMDAASKAAAEAEQAQREQKEAAEKAAAAKKATEASEPEDEAWEEALRMSREQAQREQKEAEERASAAGALAAEKEAAADAIELSVDEFIEDFNTDNNAAHQKYVNSTLRLTGKVARVVANEINNNYAITLTGEKAGEGLRDVRCKFGTEHADKVKQLSRGEKVTVQGEYAGVVVDINLRDCLFV